MLFWQVPSGNLKERSDRYGYFPRRPGRTGHVLGVPTTPLLVLLSCSRMNYSASSAQACALVV